MTRLLVSVRNLAEAQTALAGGVDLLDLKEPSHGALGAVAAAVAEQIVAFAAPSVPVSLALGELSDLAKDASPALAISRDAAYYKIGLAGCASRQDWIARWRRLIAAAPPSAAPVAVVYADGASVDAPPPDEVLAAATQVGCRAVLVDTVVKDGRCLLDHWQPAALQAFLAAARRRRLTTVIGGGLTLETIPAAAACGPDYIAVRGAACTGPRTGTLSADRLALVRAALGYAVNPRSVDQRRMASSSTRGR